MREQLESFYAEARVRCGVAPFLRDDLDSPPERLLQAVWQHQRLLRDKLKTSDGRTVRILHPGFLNREGGPDFRSAVIQFGDESAQVGDVEVDLRSSGWHSHGHDRNPAFAKVVLHVIWEGEPRAAGNAPPAVALRQVLDAPLGELSVWLGGEASQGFPEQLRGRCAAKLSSLSDKQLLELLHQAAQVRLRSKAGQFHARAKQAGWEQSLWEGLFRALGFKHNVWAMQRLAELRPLWRLEDPGVEEGASSAGALMLQARLFGLSGLLPSELTRAKGNADGYLRKIWDCWWRERDRLFDCALPRKLWRLHGIRPANHPERRLALAGLWSIRPNLARELEGWCAREIPDGRLAASLQEILQAGPDEFWSWHWTLRSAKLKAAQPMIGPARVTDVAVNVVLPWLWSRAAEGGIERAQKRIEERYYAWPAAEDNSVLRLARSRMLGEGRRLGGVLRGAAAQQGLMQIVRDFCDHSNAVCEACRFPEVVSEFKDGE